MPRIAMARATAGGQRHAAARMQLRRTHAGFTMIELMVAIVVAAIIIVFAVPSFQTTINSGRLSGASNEMLAGFQAARMEAIRSNHRTLICLSNAPDAAAPVCLAAGATTARGWIAYADANKDGNPTAAEVVRVGTVNPRVGIKASANFGAKIMFHADGIAYMANGTTPLQAAVAFCIPTKRPPQNIRYVNFSVSRASVVANNTNAVCTGAVNNNNLPP